MNLTEWAHAQGIHVTTAYRRYREGALPVPARKAGRLILVSSETAAAASPQNGVGLYARVSSHDQKVGLDRQVARLSAWAVQVGVPVVRVEAEVGSGGEGGPDTGHDRGADVVLRPAVRAPVGAELGAEGRRVRPAGHRPAGRAEGGERPVRGCRVSGLRAIASLFVAAAPAGARVRARLRRVPAG